jgi:hypothetical protein
VQPQCSPDDAWADDVPLQNVDQEKVPQHE